MKTSFFPFALITNSHFFLSLGTNKISIHISSKSQSGWSALASGNLPDVSGIGCQDAPMASFDISGRGRFVKVIMESYHGEGAALQYINVDFDKHGKFVKFLNI